jgi:hypothetical protein
MLMGVIDLVDQHCQLISRQALYSAFKEQDGGAQSAMWEGLLRLVKGTHVLDKQKPSVWLICTWTERPNAWALADAPKETGDEDSDTDSGSESDTRPTPEPESTDHSSPSDHPRIPPVINAFFSFLQLGCNGKPTSAYPAVLVLLSTIPSSVFPWTADNVEALFNSFWGAVDGRALDSAGERGTEAFTSAFVECLRFVVGKSYKGGDQKLAVEVATKQVDRLVKYVLGTGEVEKRRPLPALFASGLLARALADFERLDPGAVDCRYS